jgi:hypothetical protein
VTEAGGGQGGPILIHINMSASSFFGPFKYDPVSSYSVASFVTGLSGSYMEGLKDVYFTTNSLVSSLSITAAATTASGGSTYG